MGMVRGVVHQVDDLLTIEAVRGPVRDHQAAGEHDDAVGQPEQLVEVR